MRMYTTTMALQSYQTGACDNVTVLAYQGHATSAIPTCNVPGGLPNGEAF